MIEIEVKQGSPVEEEVETIVCSANNWLMLGSGIAGEIKVLGGAGIQDECDRIIEQNGGNPIEIGSAVFTSAGELINTNPKLKGIIHAVGMGYRTKTDEGLHDRILATPETVFLAVTSALEVADRMGMQTMAFSLMCARPGYSNLSDADAPKVMLETMIRAVRDHDQHLSAILKIYICTGAISVRTP